MGQEREVNTLQGTKTLNDDLLKDLSDDQFEKEIATVLERGVTNMRLNVVLPEDLYGEWVPNDPVEIFRKQSLGFKIDDKYAVSNALHSDGTGKPIIGDVIFMVNSKRFKVAYDKLMHKRFEETHGNKQAQVEERQYLNEKHEAVTTINNSSTQTVGAAEIAAAKAVASTTGDKK